MIGEQFPLDVKGDRPLRVRDGVQGVGLPMIGGQASGQTLQQRPNTQEHGVGQLENRQHPRQSGDARQPSPSRQATPHRHECLGAAQSRTIRTLDVKSCEQGFAFVDSGHGWVRMADIQKAQAAVALAAGQALYMGDLPPA